MSNTYRIKFEIWRIEDPYRILTVKAETGREAVQKGFDQLQEEFAGEIPEKVKIDYMGCEQVK